MVKELIIFVALCFAFSFADIEVRLLVINPVNSGRTGAPYDGDVNVTGLDNGVTLKNAMDAAVADGKFS